jgi:hypothetical protein
VIPRIAKDNYRVLQIDLSIARTDEYIPIGGDYLHVFLQGGVVTPTVRLNKTENASVQLLEGMVFRGRIDCIFLSNAAVAGATVYLWISSGPVSMYLGNFNTRLLGGGGGQIATNYPNDNGTGISLSVIADVHVYKPSSGALTHERLRTMDTLKAIDNLVVTGGVDTTIWTPAAGKRFRLLAWCLQFSLAQTYRLKEESTTIIGINGGGDKPTNFLPGNGYLSLAADNRLRIYGPAGFTVWGYLAGTEE